MRIRRYSSYALAFLVVLLSAVLATLCLPARARAQNGNPVYLVQADGVVTAYTVTYLRRALREAEASAAEVLIIRLSSEGAVVRALRPFATELAESSVPVVVYVAPEGISSGTAGLLLLSAAHLAAMAPETSFGSALPLIEVDGLLSEQTRELALQQVVDQLKEWNTARGRSVAWIDAAVREGVVLNNAQATATDPPAIDLVVRDLDELLTLLEGRALNLASGEQVILRTLGAPLQPLEASLWESLLIFLANPTVTFLLLVMAAMAGYAELVSPTVGVLAGIGFVLLIGAITGLAVLPVRWLSLLIMLLAFGLIATDLFTPSHGALTVVGLVMLVTAALNLFDAAQAPGVGVALWAVVLVGVGVAVFAAVGIVLAVRAARQPVATGREGLIGRLAEVRKRLEPEGMVFVEGALWRAVSETGEVEVGELVRITGVYQLRLSVRAVREEEQSLQV